jgi:UDP-GlcNAc3NAcA epimerase
MRRSDEAQIRNSQARALRVLTVVGARPQFIKAAVVSDALRESGIAEYLVHTGQHYSDNMSRVFFEELRIRPPDVDLGIRADTHAAQTGGMLIGLEAIMLRERPDRVLVYGDTNSTLAGALAAAKLRIAVDHVEAGLRSFNRAMPEEINRVMTDHLADLLFAPSAAAVDNLAREGIEAARVHRVGDVMYDSVLCHAKTARERSRIVADLGLAGGSFAVVTLHRAENTDDAARLGMLVAGLEELAADLPVVIPAHPRLAKMMEAQGLAFRRVRRIDPLGYLDMIALVAQARVVLTDSGGLQKEAAFLDVPCLTLREETEWVELVELGWNSIVPPGPHMRLREAVDDACTKTRAPLAAAFGNGAAGRAIAAVIAGYDAGRS